MTQNTIIIASVTGFLLSGFLSWYFVLWADVRYWRKWKQEGKAQCRQIQELLDDIMRAGMQMERCVRCPQRPKSEEQE